MKAAVRHNYGPPEILEIKELEKPVPKDGEILVKIYATTVNRTDCANLWGKPLLTRIGIGLRKPNKKITGTDFAGEVEAVGKDVIKYSPGDHVFGFNDSGLSSHAEYITISANKTVDKIPDNISFEEAAAAPEGAHYAINFINKVKLQSGQKVVVNGATGAIGSALLQLLKHHGLIVIAVCNTKNLDLMKKLGADKVINYEKEDFTRDNEKYDFVFDAVGKSTFGKCKPLLKEHGVYISSELGPKNENPLLTLTTPLFSKKKVKFPFPFNIKRSLEIIKELMADEAFKPVIDKTYPLEKIMDAYHFAASGEKTGSVVISIAQ